VARHDGSCGYLENPERDGQRESARACAAGIEIEDAVTPLDRGLVGVSADDYAKARGCRIEIEVGEGVQHVDGDAAKLDDLGCGESGAGSRAAGSGTVGLGTVGLGTVGLGTVGLEAVHIPSDRSKGSDRGERGEDGRIADISRVEDVIDALKRGDRLRPQEAVRVGDNANPDHAAAGDASTGDAAH
jgi:hypothetical protein